MEAERRGQGEAGKQRRYQAGAEAEDQQYAPHHFHHNRYHECELWEWQSRRLDITDRSGRVGNLVEAAYEEDRAQQHPAGEWKDGVRSGCCGRGACCGGEGGVFHGLSPG
jgi:hypothetical protein